MNCYYLIFRYVLILSILLFDCILLSSNKYFQSNKGSILFGLTGVVTPDNSYNYSNYKEKCAIELSITEICSNLDNLSKAGTYVIIFLSLDIILLILYSLINIAQHISLKRIVKGNISLEELSAKEKAIFT